MTLKRTWLWIAGATLIPLVAGASTTLQTTIVQNGAPISIDECVAALQPAGGSETGGYLSEYVDFTNLSERTVTEVRFAFELVDAFGRIERSFDADRTGSFATDAAVQHSPAPSDTSVRQTIAAVPSGTKILCTVRMVRFADGSVWHEGDGPPGNATIFTPLPNPPATPWHWPDDTPQP